MTETEPILATFTAGLAGRQPAELAAGLQMLIEQCRQWGEAGDWSRLRPLADAVDLLCANARAAGWLTSPPVQLLVDLTQQICAILALAGDAKGVRDSGYFRAARTHAERLDTMTAGRLNLVALVELIGD